MRQKILRACLLFIGSATDPESACLLGSATDPESAVSSFLFPVALSFSSVLTTFSLAEDQVRPKASFAESLILYRVSVAG